MATSVTYAGNSYSIPAYNDTGYAQGPGNLSAYLVALATGNLTISGGNVVLTADANFGGSFGLISTYFKSRTANIATAGFLRLAVTDLIEWRNNANGGNLTLGINGSDQLTFNGTVLGFGSVATVTGTANQIDSTGGTTPVLSLSSTLIVPGTFTIPATTNQIILGTTNRITITSPAPAASRTYTILDVLAAANFMMSEGIQTVNGNYTFSGTSTIVMAGTITVNNSVGFASNNLNSVGTITFSNPAVGGIAGTTTNNSAASGRVGEYLVATASAQTAPTSTQFGDGASISLTAGDWDVSATIWYVVNGGTSWSSLTLGISTTTGNSSVGLSLGDNYLEFDTTASTGVPNGLPMSIPVVRASLAGTTTYYLKVSATYTVSAPKYSCRISARRVR